MINKVDEIEKIIDFSWELSKNDLYASYPRKNKIADVIKDMEEANQAECSNVIACYKSDMLCGLCVYFWKNDDKYVQTTQFLINENYDETAGEFIEYIRNQLPGFELLIGVPSTNENAIKYFNNSDSVCISSIDTRMYNLKKPINYNNNSVEEINENNFDKYATFHDKFAIPLEMYYNSRNLQNEIGRFRVFIFNEKEEIHGSIFAKVGKDVAEVFGLFIDSEYENKNIERILINKMLVQLYNEFGAIDEIVYFIDEGYTNELNAALAAGFKIKDIYKCYKYIL